MLQVSEGRSSRCSYEPGGDFMSCSAQGSSWGTFEGPSPAEIVLKLDQVLLPVSDYFRPTIKQFHMV